MTRIFKHLIRIIKHKYWVAHYCFQLGLYWQGIVHDWSKFSYTEFSRSIKYWDDAISPLANEKNIHGYSETFLHHRGRNPHHYEYWVHSLDEGGVPAKMPRKYALELVCDYLAAPNISSSIFSKSKKPYYNILLDDRAGLEESYEILKYVVDEIKLNQQGNQ